MLTPEKIEELREQAREVIASEMYDSKVEITSLSWLITQIPAWKRWYLKSNQPHNYLRVTRIILPGTEENRYRWVQKFQIWVRGTLQEEYKIDADTYDFYEALWGKQEMRDMTYAVYRSPAQLAAQTEPQ